MVKNKKDNCIVTRFEYWKSEDDMQWYFHLIAPNGGVIVQSVGYMDEEDCLQAIDLLRLYSDIAPITKYSTILTQRQ